MSETSFSINDLIRRKLQTSLILISLTLCVASTLFLLLFCGKMGLGISLMVEGKLTYGFSVVFSRLIIFIGFLAFVSGAVINSFMAFLMMNQRVRDIGLIKAAGCPNDLIFGYFMTELLMVTAFGCFLGVGVGILADLASTSLLMSSGFQISQRPTYFWLVLLVFGLFSAIALIFGAKPIFDVAKIEPAKAISPTYNLGLSIQRGFRVVSKSGLTFKMALRSLSRRKSATVRIFVCLTAVLILVTVAIAGTVIAEQTTRGWVEKAIGRDVVLVAHKDMGNRYKLLLSKFYGEKGDSLFNYADEKYLIPDAILSQLNEIPEVSVDARLILYEDVEEVQGYIFDPEAAATIPVGDNRKGESIIVGVEPEKVLSEWFLQGAFIKDDSSKESVIGDSLAQKMFSMPLNQSIKLSNRTFNVVGVCMDPINNGNVTYVPLKILQNITGISKPNIAMIKVDSLSDYSEILNRIRGAVSAVNPEFEVFELNEILEKTVGFLSYMWSTIMLLPLFTLAAASLCLVGYVMLNIDQQRQEFGILRAMGAKPKTIVKIVTWQSFTVLFSSYATGIALGIIITLIILVPEPLVTGYTIIKIAGLLFIAFIIMFVSSLLPAIKLTKKPISELIT